MNAGYRGTFVIAWSQTELDGLAGAPPAVLGVGSTWRWSGQPLRVDGPSNVLVLDRTASDRDLHRHAARMIHKLVGAALERNPSPAVGSEPVGPLLNGGFEVTDGHRSYLLTLIDAGPGLAPLLMLAGDIPPAGTDLWVVRADLGQGHIHRMTDQPTGVICFTPGTLIRTEDGAVPVEALSEGDRVQTRDNGAREIQWIGSRRITGARLHALPEFRPVRVRGGALGNDRPEGDLVVSPRHRLLVRGARARALFNTDEVLVAAEDLIDRRRIHVDHTLKQVTYFHLLLERHEVVWANGVETESFHPASAPLDAIDPGQRARLLERFPELDRNPVSYGDFARRSLSRSEAAILRADAA